MAFKTLLWMGCTEPIPDTISQSPHKIQLSPTNWYQLTNAEEGLEKMTDGNLTIPMTNGKGKIIERFEAYYPLAPGETLSIDSIRFYSLGQINDFPMRIMAIDEQWKRIELATFTGSEKKGWIGPNPAQPDHFSIQKPVSGIRYLVLTMCDAPPAEIEFFGKYQKLVNPATLLKKPPVYLKDLMGINAYEWNFLQERDHGSLDNSRMSNLRFFSGIRHYLDWERIEDKKGSYTFNPAHNGSWNYDVLYEKVSRLQKNLLVCIKTIPKWLQDTYPMDQRNNENAPLAFGMDPNQPQSYLDQSKMAFQFAARYGNNKQIPDSLLKINHRPRWINDSPNIVKKGLGWVHFIECENERDKWWKGRQAYQTGREYAANLSAFYDGHMGTLGKNVGVKQADSTIQVVMGGLATPSTDYLRGMMDWCKEFRGYKANGQLNVCWDIINFHLYTADQSKNRGIAPEQFMGQTSAAKTAEAFVSIAANELNNMPVWVTETGYDIHPESPNRAEALAGTSVLETHANWLLRTAFLYARNGIEKVFFYQLYDDNPNSGQKYATTGLMEGETTTRPAAAYLGQTKRYFGDFKYELTLQKEPIIDVYQNKENNRLWIVYWPTEKGKSSTYELAVGDAKKVFVYQPKISGESMNANEMPVVNGKCTLTISETPLFVTKRPVNPAPVF